MRKMILIVAAMMFGSCLATPAAAQISGWSPINSGLPSLNVGVNSLVIDPSSPSTLYAQTVSTPIVSNSTATGLFKSDDGAATWQQLGSAANAVAVAIDSRNASNVYVGTSQGILKSSDRGVTFTDISGNLPVGAVSKIAVDPSNASALYILNTAPSAASPGSTNIIYKTTDGGAPGRTRASPTARSRSSLSTQRTSMQPQLRDSPNRPTEVPTGRRSTRD